MVYRKLANLKFLLIFVFIISFIARFYNLGNLGIWADEGYSAFLAQKSLYQIFEYLKSDSGPPFYYLILSLFIKIADTEFMLRLPSVIAGCFSVLVIFFLGKELFDKETGFWSSFIAGISPLFIYYSQLSRNYALLVFLVLSYFYFFIKIAKDKRLKYLIGYTISGTLILYTHNVGLFIIICGLICGIVTGYYKKEFRRSWLISNILIAFFYLPWFLVLIQQVSKSERTIGWIKYIWEDGVNLFGIPLSLLAFCTGGYIPSHVGIYAINGLQPLVIGIHLFLLVYLVLYLKKEGNMSNKRNLFQLVLFLMLPLIMIWISSFKIPIYLPGRTDLGVFGFFAIISGFACSKLKDLYIKVGFFTLLLAISTLTLVPHYNSKDRLKDKELSNFLISQARNEDVIIFTGLTIPSLSYYLNRSDKKLEYIFFPSDMKEHRGHFDPKPYMKDQALLHYEIKGLMDYLRIHLEPGKTVWIIYEVHQINQEFLKRIKKEFSLIYKNEERTYSLFLLDRPLKIYGFKK